MTDYPYTSGDLLEKRNTYFYTPYAGAAFMYAWRCRRNEISSTTVKPVSVPSEETPTGQLISKLISMMERGTLGADEWLKVDKLLQRFEVSKRLHEEYNSNWRPVNPNCFHNMEIYLRFAELMDLAYQSSAKLQYLNSLLKSLDTLSSLVGRIDKSQFTRLLHLISHERNYVDNIAMKLNINIGAEDA